jgi:hypothetical protein
MRSRRPRTALTLTAMGVVLLVSILAGRAIGEHTIFGATEQRVDIPEQTVTPVAEDTPGPDEAISRNWKRLQVVSVATDPAFPDPRVTPRPTPSPTPSPSPKPTPTRTPQPAYTSPPLPVPLVSHDPGEPTPTPL